MNKHTTPYASTFQGGITDGLDVTTALTFASDFLREQTAMPSAQVPVAIANGRILAEPVQLPRVVASDAAHQNCENASLRAMLSHVAPSALTVSSDTPFEGGDASSLPTGTILCPSKVGLLASMGMSGVWVRRKLPVAVLSLGRNLIDPGVKRKRGEEFDAVRPMLISALSLPWVSANDLGIVRDDDRLLRLVLQQAAPKTRVILASGIKDENDAAELKDVVLDLGGIILVNSVTIAPGQTAFLATLGGSLLLTMPGNPVGAWNVFTVLGNQVIRAAAHLAIPGGPASLDDPSIRRVEGDDGLRIAI